jgi:prepilin-type N-terminal cleavage/methylation domain-containing protein
MTRPTRRRKPGGFTLIEIAVVLLIFGMILAMAAAITRGVVASQKRSLTATRLAGVDAALVQFVQQQRRLPCPADGTTPSSNTNAGTEGARNAATGCTGNQQNGVVPFRLLGLSETDVTDGWDRRLTFRIDPTLAADGRLDMSWCDPAGQEGTPTFPAVTQCNVTCVSTTLTTCTPPRTFLATKGLQVRNVAGATLMDPAAPALTGAAYVLISHGETGGGAFVNSGALTASTLADGTEEQKNYANLALQAYYVDDSLTETSGTGHFDDTVSRPSVMGVISKAGLGPRQH